eukprot:SAG11_NODE_26773_length_340_cov_74.311203_1_plen_56_part_10
MTCLLCRVVVEEEEGALFPVALSAKQESRFALLCCLSQKQKSVSRVGTCRRLKRRR